MPFSHGSYGNVGKVAYQKNPLKSVSLVRIFQPHVGEYAIHGAYGIYLEGEKEDVSLLYQPFFMPTLQPAPRDVTHISDQLCFCGISTYV